MIRLDDDAEPEFWEEVRISETELLRLLAKVHAITHGDGSTLLLSDGTVKPVRKLFDGTYPNVREQKG